MNGHDLKVLAMIGISALGGMGLTSVLLQRSGEGERVESVERVEVKVTEEVPGAAIRWWATGAPIRYSGLGAIEKGRNPGPFVLKRRPARMGLGAPLLSFRPPRSSLVSEPRLQNRTELSLRFRPVR
jgi:hypothetical protein